MLNQPLFAALDVSLETTTICIMSADGTITKEAVVATEPESIAICLRDDLTRIERIGLEAGPLSEWLVRELSVLGIVVTLLETRQVRAALSAMIIKTDRKDARGMAHLLRTGWFRPVHVKSLSAREQRAMLAARSTLVARLKDIENSVRGLLRGFGLRLPRALRGRCSGGDRRSPHLGADFSNRCSWPAKPATDHTRQAGSGCRAGGSRLSAAHERSGRWRDCRDDLQSRRRSAGSLPIIQAGGCLLRPDSSKIPIRRDRPEWLHQPRWRCIGPGCALRGRARHHDAGCSLVEAQGLGHERGQAARCQAG
jgi:Transposase